MVHYRTVSKYSAVRGVRIKERQQDQVFLSQQQEEKKNSNPDVTRNVRVRKISESCRSMCEVEHVSEYQKRRIAESGRVEPN